MLRESHLTSEGRGGHERGKARLLQQGKDRSRRAGQEYCGLALIREGPERGQGWLSAE